MCFWDTIIFAVSSYLWHSDLYSEIVKKNNNNNPQPFLKIADSFL